MRRFIFLLLVLSGLSFNLNAQQREQYSNYVMNNFIINPGVAGSYSFWNGKAGYRTQWVTMESQPRTFFASIHGPLNYPDKKRQRHKSKGHHGLGGYVFNDVTGPLRYTGFFAGYAYHLPVTRKHYLSFGAFAGMKNLEIDHNEFHFVHTPQDNFIKTSKYRVTLPDANVGLWYYSDDFFMGLSVNQILLSGYNLSFSDQVDSESRLAMHYFYTAGYRFNLGSEWAFFPSVLIKALHPAPLGVDLNARFFYLNKLWTGLSYRHRDAVSVNVEYLFNDWLEIGYAFDWTLSDLRKYSSNTHEIIIGARFGDPKNRIVCPNKYW